MKKALALVLIALMAVFLTACGDDAADANPAPEETPVPEAQATPTPSPTPIPTATPFPRIPVDEYVLQWKNDPSRGINFMIPTHWKPGESGDRFLTYYEPVPENETGFRVSFVNKKKSTEPDSSTMRAELRKLLADMGTVYADFQTDGDITRDYMLVRFKGYANKYTFTDEYGVKMRGFVIIATYNRRIYCMNFSGPDARFEEMTPIRDKIIDSMSRVSSSNG